MDFCFLLRFPILYSNKEVIFPGGSSTRKTETSDTENLPGFTVHDASMVLAELRI